MTVDFTKEDAILDVFPRAPLLSSSKAGWNGIYLEHHCQHCEEMPKHCHAQHVVMIHHLKRPLRSEQMIDGCFQNGHVAHGDILVVPANVEHMSCWAREVKFTLLTLDPTFVTRATYELIAPERAEILPHFPKSDQLIYQIGLALKAELETDRFGSRLYAESMATALSAHLLRYYSARNCTTWGFTSGLALVDPVVEHVERDFVLLQELGLTLLYCLETHIHADHITGTGRLREITGCQGIVPHNTQAACAERHISDGEVLQLGTVKIEAFATLGHTDSHIAYMVNATHLLTGDSLAQSPKDDGSLASQRALRQKRIYLSG